MEIGVISVRTTLRLGPLHRAVFSTSPRGSSASLMLGLTTVLWPHVGRYCLGMGPSWMLSVVTDDPQMRILVRLSVIRTGGLLCCLTIFIIIYTTRKYINLRQMLMDFGFAVNVGNIITKY
jgi:hypothetical protein